MPNSKNRIAVYPGSFDPPTLGHLDIVFRAAKMFERVVVAVADNPAKKHTFSAQERLEMVRGAIKKVPNAEADVFSGLLVDYLRKKGIQVLIRGLRVVSDMDYEFQLASFNRTLYPNVETVFFDARREIHLFRFFDGQGSGPFGGFRRFFRAAGYLKKA